MKMDGKMENVKKAEDLRADLNLLTEKKKNRREKRKIQEKKYFRIERLEREVKKVTNKFFIYMIL